jgi:2'-5' RNA ligase
VGVGGELEELHRLHSRIEAEVQPWVERPENKPFRPHLTLARVSTQDRRVAARVGTVLETMDSKVHGQWRVPRILLIKSELTPKGSVYTELAEAQL